MKDSIIVNVSELHSLLDELHKDGMEYVCLSISEEDEDEGEIIPASLEVSGYKPNVTPDAWVDYDDLEAVPSEKELETKYLCGIHTSSNLL